MLIICDAGQVPFLRYFEAWQARKKSIHILGCFLVTFRKPAAAFRYSLLNLEVFAKKIGSMCDRIWHLPILPLTPSLPLFFGPENVLCFLRLLHLYSTSFYPRSKHYEP